MKLDIKNVLGKVVGKIDVSDEVFSVPINEALIHQVMVGQLANARQGTSSTKTRANVSGGGAKPRPQKGSGRARAGTIRAPQWRGGGVVFGPEPRSYRHNTPKRMKRLSLVSMLSDKAREGHLVILDKLILANSKTKDMAEVLSALKVAHSVLLIADGVNHEILRCARNIPRVKTLPAYLLNTLDLLNHRTLVMTVDSVRNAEKRLTNKYVKNNEETSSVIGN